MLEAFARWGFEAALRKFIGMFAVALWDRRDQTLWLARDRLGKKPLYYGWAGDEFLFASELSAIRSGASSPLSVSRAAVTLLLRHNYIPAPHSAYEGISKLPQGHHVKLTASDIAAHRDPPVHPYWSLESIRPAEGIDDQQAEDGFIQHLRDAVGCRLVSDVSLGAFLSGGIDSSLICAVMNEVADGRVKTFTMGFHDRSFDESDHARRIAEHFGTDHAEMFVGEEDLLAAVEKLPTLLDEPFADSSLIPTFLVSRLARVHVTVALSGDGGDELFCGYTRYAMFERWRRRLMWVPARARVFGASVLGSSALQGLVGHWPSPAWMGRRATLGGKLRRAAEMIGLRTDRDLYRSLISHWQNPESVVIDGREPATIYSVAPHWTDALPAWRRQSVQDLGQYLPDDILTKVDRASMAVSLEARTPLLDHRLVEYVLSLPERVIRRDGETKWLMKRVLARYVPRALTERPKQGFGVPLGAWLRGPLREWTLDLLARDRLVRDGFFKADPIHRLLDDHMKGGADWSACLWDVLMFQAWHQMR
jgi:asparagine synthase (glutamine-hydrolysing)